MRSLLTTAILSCTLHAAIGAALFAGPHRPAPAVDPLPQVAGDTFELPAPETDTTTSASQPPEIEAPSAAEPADEPAPPSPTRSSSALRPAPSTHRAGTSSETGTKGGALYGAVGDRSATQLAATFARSFAQTASADPAWQSAPLGPAGEATVTLTLDEAGHIVNVDVTGSPSPALASSIARTMALIKSRPFVAPTRITKVHLVATVTSGGPGDDGLDGDRFGISTHGGNASFVLPIGRRIQLRVR